MSVEYRYHESNYRGLVGLFNDMVRKGVDFDIIHIEYTQRYDCVNCIYVVYSDEDDS